MALELLAMVKASSGWIFSIAKSFIKDSRAKKRARKMALAGEDLAHKGSLESVIKAELTKLTTSSELPQNMRNESFRKWVLADKSAKQFVIVFIAKAGDYPGLADEALNELADFYEQIVGDTRKLATGPINFVISHVFGQLRATESGRSALENALALQNVASIRALQRSNHNSFPTGTSLKRLRTVSSRLLEAGRATWKMPAFVAPLTLEAHESKENKKTYLITLEQLVEALKDGNNIILYGDGGIGKTTFLLELASLCTQTARRLNPLYLDAALWARSGNGVLEYLASTPAARAAGVTIEELSKHALNSRLVLMVNGWNEIPPDRKVYCRDAFQNLATVLPSLSIVVTSRTARDTAGLTSARQIEVRGLTWKGQSDVIRSELSSVAADSLFDVLAKNSSLRLAARSPLILRGLTAQASKGASASDNVYDLLGAVVANFEQDEKRDTVLAESPLFGMQSHYLEELACVLNSLESPYISRDEALSAIKTSSTQMVEEGRLGTVPHPVTILNNLASHHVLHLQEGIARFSHQRFQEYYSAARILRTINPTDDSINVLSGAINAPAWSDSIELVAGKLKTSASASADRARLVRSAEKIDLAYACELAGQCAFSKSDDAALHDRLIVRIEELSASTLAEVKNLATACKIASCLPAFGDSLWALLESNDEQVRLQSHRANGTSISMAQLGPKAEARIEAWNSKRRTEFLHEIASNSDNYDYLVSATADSDSDVRAAAILALLWEYPTSTAGLNAWIDAPIEVQTKRDLITIVLNEQKQGYGSDRIREQLGQIAASKITDDTRLSLIMAFPAELGPTEVEFVLAQLKIVDHRASPDTLISISKVHAPKRLHALAIELLAGPNGAPHWVGQVLLRETTKVRESAFDRAWEALESRSVQYLNSAFVGPLASKHQTRRSVAAYVRNGIERRSGFSDADFKIQFETKQLLAHAPGDDLFDVVLELSTLASYEESIEFAEILLTRISRKNEPQFEANSWSPTNTQFGQLFKLLGGKPEGSKNPQDILFVLLACIASHVAPEEFGPLLIEALRRHLDAWTTYHSLLDEWLRNPSSPRPNNPTMGHILIDALTRWGIGALPGVLQLLSHQSASDAVPLAIGRLTSVPWTNSQKQATSDINTDLEVAHQRRDTGRVFQQPSLDYQPATDDAARALVNFLNNEVDRRLAERRSNPESSGTKAEYNVGTLAGILANLPSADIVEPVIRALGSGLLGIYAFIGAVRGLTRQGWVFSDVSAARELEALYERETSPAWAPDSKRRILAELCQLMLLVEPPTLLTLPLSHYLNQWQRLDGPSSVIRILGNMKTERAWPALLSIGQELSVKQQPPRDLVYAISSAVRPNNFSDFAKLIASGALFSWSQNEWDIERIAPYITKIVKDAPERLILLTDSCRKCALPLSNVLLWEVLSTLGDEDEKIMEISLEALDAEAKIDVNIPAYRALRNMFKLESPMGGGLFMVHQKSCNSLRRQLYQRAKSGRNASESARRILASLECQRREAGRPIDEPRHPEVEDGLSWTNAL